ncbi:MAG: type II toxin-antitoxin system HicB family antitoxin [Saprospiraceae bacterium]|nr:type II toxin-antitoxin system HicB family antitoxin [Saprospiraceae bacterium]
MKKLAAIIERNEDSFFAYVEEIEGCVAGGASYEEVKVNLEEIINEFKDEDEAINKQLNRGYTIKYEVDLESVFNLIPEVNITQFANLIKMNPGLLRQYVSGTKKASEKQTNKVMEGIRLLTDKLKSIQLIT